MPHQPHCSRTTFPNRQAICHSRFQLIQWINLKNNCTTVGFKTIARSGINTKRLNEIASKLVNVKSFKSRYSWCRVQGVHAMCFSRSQHTSSSLWRICIGCNAPGTWENHMSSDQLTWLFPVNWGFYYLFAGGLKAIKRILMNQSVYWNVTSFWTLLT